MNVVLGNLANINMLIYLDNICVASSNIEYHFEKLEIVIKRLREHKLRLKPSKYLFFKQPIGFLGFHISNGSVKTADKNVQVVKIFKRLASRKQVRSFLGTLNSYRCIIPDLSKILT